MRNRHVPVLLLCSLAWGAGGMAAARDWPRDAPSPAVAAAVTVIPSPAPRAVREACEPDAEAFCADAAGNPFRVRSCMQDHAGKLRALCRAALEAEGLLPR